MFSSVRCRLQATNTNISTAEDSYLAKLAMAEALSLIGLVSNVLQFVDVGTNLVRKYREIYSSVQGATAVNDEIEVEVRQVKALVEDVKASVQPYASKTMSSNTERQLENFLLAWNTVAERLLRLLEDHKVKNTPESRSIQVLKQVWRMEMGRSTRKDIAMLQAGLEKLQAMILLCLTAIIRFVNIYLQSHRDTDRARTS